MSEIQKTAQPPGNEPPAIENEFVWAIRPFLKRCSIIFSCWTTPSLEVDTFTRDDGVSARAFALFLIAALTFAVRGDNGDNGGANPTAVFTAFAGGIAIILSAVLNILSRTYKIRERLVISAYASTIIVMFFFVIFQEILTLTLPFLLYNSFFWYGDVIIPAVLGGIATFALLLMKSAWWDEKPIGRRGFRHGSILTVGSTIIVIIIALLSSRIFHRLVELVSKLKLHGD
jgi:hypothetical protein